MTGEESRKWMRMGRGGNKKRKKEKGEEEKQRRGKVNGSCSRTH